MLCCTLRLAAVPPTVLRGCILLATLSLHSNPITTEALRACEGFQEFDARRFQKHDKQVRHARTSHSAVSYESCNVRATLQISHSRVLGLPENGELKALRICWRVYMAF